MSQKTLITLMVCMTVILKIWMLHSSLCELRMNLWGAAFAAVLQSKSTH